MGTDGMDSSATLEFTAPGEISIFCTIHTGMEMNVTVVDDGPTTTQAEADAAAEASREVIAGTFEPTREARLAETSTSENDDGSTTWNVFADAGAPTQDLPAGSNVTVWTRPAGR